MVALGHVFCPLHSSHWHLNMASVRTSHLNAFHLGVLYQALQGSFTMRSRSTGATHFGQWRWSVALPHLAHGCLGAQGNGYLSPST
jgi:hypothetical protein